MATLIVPFADHVRCFRHVAEFTARDASWSTGTVQSWRPDPLQPRSSLLLVRGEAYRAPDVTAPLSSSTPSADVGGATAAPLAEISRELPVPWTEVAADLEALAPDAELYRSYLSSLRGSFWIAHVRRATEAECADEDVPLVLFAGADEVGTIPLWISSESGSSSSCTVSPHRRPAGVHFEGVPRHICPRLVVSWNADSGPTCSRPAAFFGLHSSPSSASNAPVINGKPLAANGLSNGNFEAAAAALEARLRVGLRRCVPPGTPRVGLLFSGGLDSGLLAYLCSRGDLGTGCEYMCYSAGFHSDSRTYPEDLAAAQAAAETLGVGYRQSAVDLDAAAELLYACAPEVADFNSVKASVGMTILAACRLAAQDGARLVLSGLGSEEVFAGYFRHERACAEGDAATARDRTLGLAQMWHRDLQRDFALASLAGVEIRYPFLDRDVAALALRLPAALPCRDSAGLELTADGGKGALRVVARRVGAPALIYERRKRAAQYGSRFAQALKLICSRAFANGEGVSAPVFRQANYVMALPGASHGPVALVFTSGKDSVQAYCLHRTFRTEFACVIPPLWRGDAERTREGLEAARVFARRSGLPLLETTPAEVAEVEAGGGYDMDSLESALRVARDDFGAEGATCGHVCDLNLWGGLVRACDTVGLRAYAPLWGSPSHESVMRRMVVDRNVLVPTRFPNPAYVGKRVETVAQVDALFKALREASGDAARDDSDGGLVECTVAECPFLDLTIS
eukprot:TRINITY_DN20133_c0_g3_i1.p1 TRINITY_DN20133_c0_g3~~TRINITY_DN20133_c0_g3_i1.p1  ORF type:complete len:743 (-),score=133.31 TRINITY_DN20133_c0_g3_i1:124-2352(-)